MIAIGNSSSSSRREAIHVLISGEKLVALKDRKVRLNQERLAAAQHAREYNMNVAVVIWQLAVWYLAEKATVMGDSRPCKFLAGMSEGRGTSCD
jgi:hypothetical protein